MKKRILVFDFGIKTNVNSSDVHFIQVLKILETMSGELFDCYYIAGNSIDISGIKKTNYDEVKTYEDIDIWFSIDIELPDFIRRSPATTTYLLVTNVRDAIYLRRSKNKNDKIDYDIEYFAKYFDNIVFLNEKDMLLYSDFYKVRNNQTLIFADDVVDIGRKISSMQDRGDNTPLVTVVTITYNLIDAGRKTMIEQCIESVKKQSYPFIEHIIIDGASTDGTLEYLSDYQKRGDITIYSEPDDGLYDAMNKGLKMAKGKYVAFLNSDDHYSDAKGIEYSVKRLEVAEADYSFADALIVNEDGTTFNWCGNIEYLAFATHYCHQSMLVKTEVLRKLNGFNLNYKVSADSDLMIRLYAGKYKHVYVPCQIVNYRGGGVSAQNREISQNDHSSAFFSYVGYKLGLSLTECVELWQFCFFKDMHLDQRINLLKKLSREFEVDSVWITALNEGSLIRKIENKLISKKMVVVKRRESHGRIYAIAYLFGVIPCFIKIKKAS